MKKTEHLKAAGATDEPVIETSAIRLTPEETRLIIKHVVAGKPIDGHYHSSALAELGILKRVEVPEEQDTARKVAECWKRARKALTEQDGQRLHQCMHDLENLGTDRDRNKPTYLFELSDLGKQIARGISIRMNQRR